jgi:hypothetical protein
LAKVLKMLPHLLAAVMATQIAGACSAAETRDAVAKASVAKLGEIDGRAVYLAGLQAPCLCGNVNCPYLVFRDDPRAPHVLLQTFGWDVRPIGAAKPLPQLRERAHDSALITDETIDTYRNGAYVVTAASRVRGDTGAAKPDQIPLRFAAGTSAARVRGSVSLGWYDQYVFSARRGQTLRVDGVQSAARLDLVLIWGDGKRTELVPGTPLALPQSGSYLLHVENGSPSDDPPVPYAFTIAIR